MHAATADAVIDAINEYVDAKMDAMMPATEDEPFAHLHNQHAVAQLDRAHDRLRHVLMTGIP